MMTQKGDYKLLNRVHFFGLLCSLLVVKHCVEAGLLLV